MALDKAIISVFGTVDFAQYEQDVYEEYQAMAGREIITKLNELLSNPPLPGVIEAMERSMRLSLIRIS